MGRSKKLNGENITNEKILGKLPKVKSNIGNLDFDEDSIDGISILSFKTFDDLKEYYPLEKIQPDHLQEQPKKEPAKKRKIKDKAEKSTKPSKVKRKAVIKQPALGASNLTQFDKSESEGEDVQKTLLVKTEESPPPSPLKDIPQLGSEPPVTSVVPAVSSANISTPAIKSEGCSTSCSSSSVPVMATTPGFSSVTAAPVAITCGSGSPIYQPATQHLPIPLTGTRPPTMPIAPPPSMTSRLPTPPSAAPAQPFYHGLHRHPVAAPSHPPHGMPFHFQQPHGAPHSAAELEMKLNAAKYDPRSYLLNGRFPTPADMTKLRAVEYDRYLLSRSLVGGPRPLFPTTAPRPPPPPPTPPVNPSILPNRNELAAGSSAGTAIKRRLEKKWNSIHVYIARMIYKDQQKLKSKDPLNGASANNGAGESAARSFLASSKREVMREYPQFPGMHNLPPTPASPFPHPPFNTTMHPSHHGLGLRGLQSLHGLGNRLPAPGMRAPYAAAAAAAAQGLYPPGFDPLRHSIPNYSELSRLDQERLHQHLAGMRSSELLSRTMYESSLRQQQAQHHHHQAQVQQSAAAAAAAQQSAAAAAAAQHQAAQHREHEMQMPPHVMSREMLLHMEEQRRKLIAANSDPQKLLTPNMPNLADLYMHPQHLQAQLKYPPVGPSPHLAQFPHLLNRLDARARFSHLIPQPKGPE